MANDGKKKITRNAVRCDVCKDVIESVHRHHFNRCTCGNVAVDGGKDYLRRVYSTDKWTELSEPKGVEEQE